MVNIPDKQIEKRIIHHATTEGSINKKLTRRSALRAAAKA